MLEAQHFSAAAEPKGSYVLPAEYDGTVNETVLYHAVRAFQNNQRQGTASTKTRAEISGGSRKPWRQKGTGRARQGTIRAAQWRGGGVVFGPRPRSYRTDLPRKVRRLARQSALNARAGEGALYVIDPLEFETPKTKQMLEILTKLGLEGQKVLVLTAGSRPNVYLSGRNLQDVYVMPYADVSAYELLWSDAVLVEESALGGQEVEGAAAKPVKRAKKATTAKKKTTKKTAKKATKKTAKRKGGSDA
jgi:large subunit ribosomal protein L4